MGIPYYFYSLYKQYQGEDLMIDEHTLRSMRPSHLFFDYNSMIHPCAHLTLSMLEKNDVLDTDFIEERIIEGCIDYTRYILAMVKPKEAHIMIDGVAPRAKINQQRERRYKSYFYSKKGDDEIETDKVKWNTNKITPGTNFMQKLKGALERFVDNYQQEQSFTQCYLSSADEKGEGEHKMMKIINSMENDKPEGKICIYGLDADLIMLSLLSKHNDSIVLVRDNTFNNTLSNDKRVFTYLDISKLANAIVSDMSWHTKTTYENTLAKRYILMDYVFLCFMLGNDFLHHIPSLKIKDNGAHMLMKAYARVKIINKTMYLINGKALEDGKLGEALNWSMFTKILQETSDVEQYYFSNIAKEKQWQNIEEAPNVHVITRFSCKQNIRFDMFKKMYYRYYGIDNIAECCYDYIEGLLWVLGYYSGHIHDNWTWAYPHGNTPFASDIFAFLKTQGEKRAYSSLVNRLSHTPHLMSSKCITSLEQLLHVLPRESLLEILKEIDPDFGKRVGRILNMQSQDIEKAFPRNIVVSLVGKDQQWQSSVLFDKVDDDIFHYFISQ
jgi:5'-3' exoribonuclease 1